MSNSACFYSGLKWAKNGLPVSRVQLISGSGLTICKCFQPLQDGCLCPYACLCMHVCLVYLSLESFSVISGSLGFYSHAILERLVMKNFAWLPKTSFLEQSERIFLMPDSYLLAPLRTRGIDIGLYADMCMPTRNILNGTHAINRSPTSMPQRLWMDGIRKEENFPHSIFPASASQMHISLLSKLITDTTAFRQMHLERQVFPFTSNIVLVIII